MRCPKCQYITFGSADRCRNCGYDFSLSSDAPAVDLPIQRGEEPIGPMADLNLAPGGRQASAVPDTFEPPAPEPDRVPTSPLDLPLFTGGPDDAPLVTPPAVPRPPLSVRRTPPAPPRPRGPRGSNGSAEPALDLGEPPRRRRAPAEPPPATQSSDASAVGSNAPLGARLGAGMIDLLIVGSIAAAVVYLTLRALGLPSGDLWRLPPVPLVAYLLMIVGGYFVAFTTAGGQTIGKMAAGIRVVPAASPGSLQVAVGAAVVRAAAYIVSVLPAGLGLLPVLFDADRRALHDRLADTRVVRA